MSDNIMPRKGNDPTKRLDQISKHLEAEKEYAADKKQKEKLNLPPAPMGSSKEEIEETSSLPSQPTTTQLNAFFQKFKTLELESSTSINKKTEQTSKNYKSVSSEEKNSQQKTEQKANVVIPFQMSLQDRFAVLGGEWSKENKEVQKKLEGFASYSDYSSEEGEFEDMDVELPTYDVDIENYPFTVVEDYESMKPVEKKAAQPEMEKENKDEQKSLTIPRSKF